ncbi:hypothetical protein AWC38_SpisGene9023 [Stylophora pistillata]|uniref:Uncharacterized protein n=1 Tax=Stylophora pistillata TaxID=50429 RepID=A0A2B4SBC7_STYPI|nr:hypothetical protein AWC38_SpisGene9023 [Stylophora pistillata]
MIIRMERLQTTRTKTAVAAAVASLPVIAASHVAVVSHAAALVVIKTFAITTNMTTNVACITIAACITCIISLMTAPAPSHAVADAHKHVATHKLAAAHKLAVAYKLATAHKLAAAVVRGAVVGSRGLLVMERSKELKGEEEEKAARRQLILPPGYLFPAFRRVESFSSLKRIFNGSDKGTSSSYSGTTGKKYGQPKTGHRISSKRTSRKLPVAGSLLRPESLPKAPQSNDVGKNKGKRCGCCICHGCQPCVGGCMPNCDCDCCRHECDEGLDSPILLVANVVGVLFRVPRKPLKRSPQRSHAALLVVAHVALFQVVTIVVIIFIITITTAALAVIAATAATAATVAHAVATVAIANDLKGRYHQHS